MKYLCLCSFVLVGLLGSASLAFAEAPKAVDSNAVRSQAQTLIDEADLSVSMARDGQYGRIKKDLMQQLEAANARIAELLGSVDSSSELGAGEQQQLARAQAEISRILRPEEGDRRVCQRIAATGTRLGAMECMTVAERRQRARATRDMVVDMQRGSCIPGETSRCGF